MSEYKSPAQLYKMISNLLNSLEVTIQEEVTKTGGHYQATAFELDVAAGDATKEVTVSFPFAISVLAAEWNNEAAFDGDSIEFVVGEKTNIGSITAAVAAAATVIDVSSTVIDNVSLGKIIHLGDGTSLDLCGRVINVDPANSQITVETATVNSFAVATPTYVKMTTEMLRKSPLCGCGRVQLGESKIGGSYIPPNTVLKAVYHNTNATAKKLRFTLEYLY